MEQLIERINKLSTAAKTGIIFAIIAVLTGGTYFFVISDLQQKIDGIRADQAAQEQTLAKKQEIADNLNERRREMDLIEARFQEALTQLPLTKDIEELLAQLNDVGKKSGLEISRVTPLAESPDGFISRIPITMQVSGNYHEIAMFLQEVANLRRIVNVSDLKLTQPQKRGDKISLTSEFTATTFRFSDSNNQGTPQ